MSFFESWKAASVNVAGIGPCALIHPMDPPEERVGASEYSATPSCHERVRAMKRFRISIS